MSSNWLIPIGAGSQPKVNLFCFPYAGAGASVFRLWSKWLDESIRGFAIQPPGRESRFLEAPLTDLAAYSNQAAKAILTQAGNEPVVLFGHSLGAAAAFETARCLAQLNKNITALVVSGRQAPNIKSRKQPISHLPDNDFIRELASLDGTPKEVLANSELIELLLPTIRADFAMSESYLSLNRPALRCPVIAVGARDDIWLTSESLDEWRDVTLGSFETKWFEGNHFFLNVYTADLLRYLSEQINRFNINYNS